MVRGSYSVLGIWIQTINMCWPLTLPQVDRGQCDHVILLDRLSDGHNQLNYHWYVKGLLPIMLSGQMGYRKIPVNERIPLNSVCSRFVFCPRECENKLRVSRHVMYFYLNMCLTDDLTISSSYRCDHTLLDTDLPQPIELPLIRKHMPNMSCIGLKICRRLLVLETMKNRDKDNMAK